MIHNEILIFYFYRIITVTEFKEHYYRHTKIGYFIQRDECERKIKQNPLYFINTPIIRKHNENFITGTIEF